MATEMDDGIELASVDQDIEQGRLPSSSAEQVTNGESAPSDRNSNSSAVVDASQNDRDELPPVLFRWPNTALGIPMGLAGHAIMWKILNVAKLRTETSIKIAYVMNIVCWYLSCVLGVLFLGCYAYKAVTSFPLVKAEWQSPVRCHFFNVPNLTIIMLLLSLPPDFDVPSETIRILWAFAFCYQLIVTQQIYQALMFSATRNFSEARPQFLLSTVGWFLLSNLGFSCKIPEEWGIGLPQMCFGAGFILYIDIVVFIFSNLHKNPNMKGTPAMFLLIAPPSVGVVSLDLFYKLVGGEAQISPASELLLGWVLVLFLLLIRMVSSLCTQPAILGEYWAYVFPVAGASTATIWYAMKLDTNATYVLALIMIVVAALSLLLVSGRTIFHMFKCLRGQAVWNDPLFRTEHYSESGLSIWWTSFRSHA